MDEDYEVDSDYTDDYDSSDSYEDEYCDDTYVDDYDDIPEDDFSACDYEEEIDEDQFDDISEDVEEEGLDFESDNSIEVTSESDELFDEIEEFPEDDEVETLDIDSEETDEFSEEDEVETLDFDSEEETEELSEEDGIETLEMESEEETEELSEEDEIETLEMESEEETEELSEEDEIETLEMDSEEETVELSEDDEVETLEMELEEINDVFAGSFEDAITETDEIKENNIEYSDRIEGLKDNNSSRESDDQTKQQDDTEEIEIKTLSDYMSAHNYGRQDFATYSQDPQWRRLMRQEYPNYELPPLNRDKAYSQLVDYMNSHGYTRNDFSIYSQDPIWRELQSAAYPDYELPEINITNPFHEMTKTLVDSNVAFRPLNHVGNRSQEDIIDRISGGDSTKGSCSSVALAYFGNKAGYDVLDYRDGESRTFFSMRSNINSISNLPGVKSTRLNGYNDFDCANSLLESMEKGKEYYFATGQHAAAVRRGDNGFEFLELQHPTDQNGWHILDDYMLRERFGCKSVHEYEFSNYLIDSDSLIRNKEFLNLLGYLNTAENSQKKGLDGNVK